MRKAGLLGAAVFVTAIVFSTATYAVLTFYDNKKLSDQNADFINGYIAGAADLYAAFEDANYVAPERRAEVQRAVKCSTSLKAVADTWRDYYRQGRVKDPDNAAASIYLALRDKC